LQLAYLEIFYFIFLKGRNLGKISTNRKHKNKIKKVVIPMYYYL